MGLKAAFTLCFLFTGGITFAQDAFDNIRHVGHSTSLTFLKKDGHCDSGPVVGSSVSSVTVSLQSKTAITIPRNELLRVGDTELAKDMIYSGRSSWQDVIEVNPGHAEVLHVVTTSGESYRGKRIRTSADEIVVKGLGGSTTILKKNIARVDYLRQRPATDGEQHFGQEAPFLLVFNPDTWLRASTLSPKMTVTLYDSSLPEDNALMKCLRSNDAPVK